MENWERCVRRAPDQFRAYPQGIIRGVPGAKHPLVATDGANAATDLIGECLECETAVCRGERAGEAIAEAVSGLCCKEDADGFFVAAREEALDASVGNLRPNGCAFRP